LALSWIFEPQQILFFIFKLKSDRLGLGSGIGFGLRLCLGIDEHANEHSGDTREDKGCSFRLSSGA
jgi:hypothetical protein